MDFVILASLPLRDYLVPSFVSAIAPGSPLVAFADDPSPRLCVSLCPPAFALSAKVKAHELREKGKDELLKQLEDLKNELSQLKVAKVSGQGGPSKMAKIKVIRRSIARVLTVYNANERDNLRKAYRTRRYKPLDLRVKRTKAIRARLTSTQAQKKTLRQQKREAYFPIRKYALKAI